MFICVSVWLQHKICKPLKPALSRVLHKWLAVFLYLWDTPWGNGSDSVVKLHSLLESFGLGDCVNGWVTHAWRHWLEVAIRRQNQSAALVWINSQSLQLSPLLLWSIVSWLVVLTSRSYGQSHAFSYVACIKFYQSNYPTWCTAQAFWSLWCDSRVSLESELIINYKWDSFTMNKLQESDPVPLNSKCALLLHAHASNCS